MKKEAYLKDLPVGTMFYLDNNIGGVVKTWLDDATHFKISYPDGRSSIATVYPNTIVYLEK